MWRVVDVYEFKLLPQGLLLLLRVGLLLYVEQVLAVGLLRGIELSPAWWSGIEVHAE
jgi:hypothetical protein